MTISELIHELQTAQAKVGDVEVLPYFSDAGCDGGDPRPETRIHGVIGLTADCKKFMPWVDTRGEGGTPVILLG